MVPLLSLKSLTVEFPEQGFSSGWIPFMAKRPSATRSNIVSKACADRLINKPINCLLRSHGPATVAESRSSVSVILIPNIYRHIIHLRARIYFPHFFFTKTFFHLFFFSNIDGTLTINAQICGVFFAIFIPVRYSCYLALHDNK